MTDTAELLAPIARLGGQIRWFGIGLVVLGAIAIYSPEITGMTVSVVVGIVMILGGIIRTAFAWIAPGWGSLFLRALVGILTVIAGGYMIAQPDAGSEVLAIVLMFYLFADGITSLIFALRMPPAAGGAWMMLGAVASLIIGILMWQQWPLAGQLAVGVLIGIKLVLDGIVLIGVGSVAKAAVS